MKSLRVCIVAFLLVAMVACSHPAFVPVNIFPVPPEDSRWEGKEIKHIPLPIQGKDDRDALANQLRYGLSHANERSHRAVDLTNYDVLLNMLADKTTMAAITGSDFKDWFTGDRVDTVIDAREQYMPDKDHGPFALRSSKNQGVNWWIFYQDDNHQLTGVMVVRLTALTQLVESKK